MSKAKALLMQSAVLTGLCYLTPTLTLADEGSDLWTRLRGVLSQEEAQSQQEAQETTLQEQLEQGRRLRAMHREAVLLSELNVAWVYDQLEHWDCRMGEQKVSEVENRMSELDAFGQRLDTLCSGLGAETGHHQRQVCERQRADLDRTASELEGLGRRYATTCSGPDKQTEHIGVKQPWQ